MMLARGFFADAAGPPGAAPSLGAIDVGGFVEVLGRPRTLRIIGFTLGQSLVATLGTVAVGIPLAFALYRLRFAGQALPRAFIMVPFVLPTVTVGTSFQALLGPGGPLYALGLDQSFQAVLLAIVFMNLAVVARTVGAAWQQLDPRPELAAAALGASHWRVLWSVTMPRLWPSIRAAALIVFLFCATAFGIVLILGGVRFGTVESEIYQLTTQFLDLRGAAVLSVVQLAIVCGLLVAARRGRAVRQSARLHTVAVGWRHAAVLGVAGLAVVFVATPIVGLVARSLRVQGEPSGWGWGNYVALFAPARGGSTLVSAGEALSNSLRIAADATWLALALALAICVVLSRRPRTRWGGRVLRAYDAFLMLPLGVSAVTLGFGFLITMQYLPGDLRTSGLLVPVAQALVALPLTIRTVLPVMQGISPDARAAARVLGAGSLRVFATVDWPVLWRPLLAAAGLAYAVSLGEFGATTFLARPEAPTLPVVIFTLLGRPDTFGVAVAGSVLLAGVTAVVLGLVERLRGASGWF
ncbi:iron ABC transporter permease [Micrococcales bacterium 31B]|nr:iron ABC transporter permease [Micrococcales bacterium 31B]